MISTTKILVSLFSLTAANIASAADYPTPTEGDYTIRDFKFGSGETLPELKIHYRTLGKIDKDAHGKVTNAVLIMHGTTGSGAQFIRPEFAGELFGKDQPLDATKFFIVLPDGIGHGKSSKPSDGLHAKFPRYGYIDMVEAQYRLLTEGLGLNHARLVMGTSMGGMHTWLWGESHPDFMDALMPLASLPTQISGRNRAWRRMIIDAIRNDSAWNGGEYKTQPPSLRTAAEMLWFMSQNPVLRQEEAPTLAKTDEALDKFVAGYLKGCEELVDVKKKATNKDKAAEARYNQIIKLAQTLGRSQADQADLVLLCLEGGRLENEVESALLERAHPPVQALATIGVLVLTFVLARHGCLRRQP